MALNERPSEILRFGIFEVDLRAGELRRRGVKIKLQEQPFQVLAALLLRPGEIVGREELRNRNWAPDTFVDFDNSLNTAINKLREALGDSADNPRFIETLPRRGYRFVAPVSSDHRKETQSLTAKWKLAAGILATILLTATAGSLYMRSRQARRLTDKDTIVLADFANSTGDPVFDDALKQGLRVQLEQSPFLNILSDQKVGEQLRLMGRAKDERLTQDLAREVCERTGSKALLAGTISNLGTHYVIGLNALNCRSGDVLASEQAETNSREHVLRSLGESATNLRRKLGESLASIQKHDVPLNEVSTASLEALRAYSLGIKTWAAKGPRAALPFFQHAADLDPAFAMAFARIGSVYAYIDEPSLAVESIRKAYELRGKVSERERLYIEAHYYEQVTGELEKEVQTYELWHETHPQDLGSVHNLVTLYAVLGQYEKALQVGQELLPRQPENEDTYAEVAAAYIYLNRFAEADFVLKQAAARKLESEDLLIARYTVAFLKGDQQEMDRLEASAKSIQGSENTILFCAAGAAAYRGRLKEEQELVRRAIDSASHEGAAERLATYLASTALLEAQIGDLQHAGVDAERALGLSKDFYTEGASALALARIGKIERALKLVADLNEKFPKNTMVQRMWLPTIRAAVALERRNAKEAIEMLEATSPYDLSMGALTPAAPVFIRGLAYLMLRNGSAAAKEFQWITDHPGIMRSNPVAVVVHLGLGRAYAMEGDTAKARAAYQDFLTLWRDADPDIPILKQAKAEYAKLQ